MVPEEEVARVTVVVARAGAPVQEGLAEWAVEARAQRQSLKVRDGRTQSSSIE
jgi:hypothetical protein